MALLAVFESVSLLTPFRSASSTRASKLRSPNSLSLSAFETTCWTTITANAAIKADPSVRQRLAAAPAAYDDENERGLTGLEQAARPPTRAGRVSL
jgi:hypothetical protein